MSFWASARNSDLMDSYDLGPHPQGASGTLRAIEGQWEERATRKGGRFSTTSAEARARPG